MLITIFNRTTNEKQKLSLEEFKDKFRTELDYAFQCYIRHENEKKSFLPKFMRKNVSEADFFLSLVWNFNNYSNSNWYIRSIR